MNAALVDSVAQNPWAAAVALVGLVIGLAVVRAVERWLDRGRLFKLLRKAVRKETQDEVGAMLVGLGLVDSRSMAKWVRKRRDDRGDVPDDDEDDEDDLDIQTGAWRP